MVVISTSIVFMVVGIPGKPYTKKLSPRTGPTERTPKHEYISNSSSNLGSVGKVPSDVVGR